MGILQFLDNKHYAAVFWAIDRMELDYIKSSQTIAILASTSNPWGSIFEYNERTYSLAAPDENGFTCRDITTNNFCTLPGDAIITRVF